MGNRQNLNSLLIFTKKQVVRVAVKSGFAERGRGLWKQIGIPKNPFENGIQLFQKTGGGDRTPLQIPVESCVYFCLRLYVELEH